MCRVFSFVKLGETGKSAWDDDDDDNDDDDAEEEEEGDDDDEVSSLCGGSESWISETGEERELWSLFS